MTGEPTDAVAVVSSSDALALDPFVVAVVLVMAAVTVLT